MAKKKAKEAPKKQEEPKKLTGVRLPASTIKELKYIALEQDISLNELLLEAVEGLLKKYQTKK
jgi:predicted HicB family RNase H-like nuclease